MKIIDKTKITYAIVFFFLFFFLIYPILFSSYVRADETDEETVKVTAIVAPNSTAIFSGLTCPLCRVYVERGAVIEESGLAQNDATFQVSVEDLPTGTYLFEVYAIDTEGFHSSTSSFTLTVSQGTITSVSGILLSPTLGSNESKVIKGAEITFFGQTVPNSVVTILIDGGSPFIQVNSEADGGFYYIFSTVSLSLGTHTAEARVASGGNDSQYSPFVEFEVKAEEEEPAVSNEETKKRNCEKADYDSDSKVNLVDFSIFLYWYEKNSVPVRINLNNDNKLDLTDFSILIYCWSG
jgi:hypothetical protein